MRRNAISVLKFFCLCMVFVTIPFMISWTLNFFFPIDDFPVDYTYIKTEEEDSNDVIILNGLGDIPLRFRLGDLEHDSHQEMFDPGLYSMPKQPDNIPVDPNEQTMVNYIANQLQITYEIVNNYAEKWFYTAKLTLRNKGNEDIVALTWTIYMFHFTIIEPKVMRPNHTAVLGDGQFRISHIDGSLYMLEPTSSFTGLKAEEEKSILLTNANCMVSNTDAFPNWYVVSPLSSPRIIVSTGGTDPGFVRGFDHPDKWRRRPGDLYDPYSPEKRYFINADAHDYGHVKQLIIPTPLNITVTEDRAFDLGSGNWAIYYDDGLLMEANILSGQIDIPTVKTLPQENFIHLAFGSVVIASDPIISSVEAYTVTMDTIKNIVTVTGNTAAGVFYGIQTLLSVYSYHKKEVRVINVTDRPRFPVRGLMLDVARNFFPVYEVIKILDAMAMYKLNLLHLHLTDDQGWRIEIPGLEELTRIGSRRNHNFTQGLAIEPFFGSGPFSNNSGSGFYSVLEYRMILRHAKSRHIVVIPEVDMPGHIHAAVASMEARYRRICKEGDCQSDPSLLAQASKYRLTDPDDNSSYFAPGGHRFSTLNPCIESTYNFVEHVVTALQAIHKDIMPLEAFHMGGDEVPKDAFSGSPLCEKFRLGHPEGVYNTSVKMQQYFVKRVAEILSRHSLNLQSWEDAVLAEDEFPFNLTQLPITEVTTNMWNNIWEAGRGHRTARFANAGYKVVLSHATHLYFDHPQEPDPEERGLYWAQRFIDTRRTFSFQPNHIYDNMDVQRDGSPINKSEACAEGGFVKCEPVVKENNIIGMSGHVWTETIRTNDHLEEMLFPRLLALAERSWHRSSWEGIPDEHVRDKLRLEDWELFANTVGHKELSRLEAAKLRYYLPPPGALVTQGDVKVNTAFPGQIVQYSKDNGTTWTDIEPGKKFDAGTILLATRSFNLLYRGRSVAVQIPP